MTSLSLEDPPVSLSFAAVPDVGLSDRQFAERRARELESQATFLNQTAPAVASLADLHTFVFSQHTSYAARSYTERTMINPTQEHDTLGNGARETY